MSLDYCRGGANPLLLELTTRRLNSTADLAVACRNVVELISILFTYKAVKIVFKCINVTYLVLVGSDYCEECSK